MIERSERRTVRPFASLEPFEGLLDNILFSVNGQQISQPKTYLEAGDFSNLTIRLEFGIRPEEVGLAANELGVAIENLQLGVILYGNTLRKSQVLRSVAIDENLEKTLQFHSSELPEILADKLSGFDLTFAIYLKESIKKVDLLPSAAGTWLTKKNFQVRPERSLSFFSPTGMTRETKKELSIPSQTLLHLKLNSSAALYATSMEDLVTIYVDDDVLKTVQSSRSAASETFALLIARSAIGSILELFSKSLNSTNALETLAEELSDNPSDDRVFAKLVRRSQKVLGYGDNVLQTLQEIKDCPQDVASKLEAKIDLRKDVSKALERGNE